MVSSSKENGNDGETDGCCCVATQDGPIGCRPYKDGFIMAAKIISIVAFLFSWVWWVSSVISIVAMIMIQFLWCCRMNKGGLLASAFVSGIAAIACLFAGIWVLVVWKDETFCHPLTWTRDDDDGSTPRSGDFCPQEFYAIFPLVDAVLWSIVTGFLLYFVYSGRYQKWEAKWTTPKGLELPATEV